MQPSIFFTPQVTREALSTVIFVFEDLTKSLSTSEDHEGSSSNYADNQFLFAWNIHNTHMTWASHSFV